MNSTSSVVEDVAVADLTIGSAPRILAATVDTVGHTLVDAVQHGHHFSAVHVVSGAHAARCIVTLEDAAVRGRLNDVRVPLARRVIDELRCCSRSLEVEGADDQSRSFRAVDVAGGRA